MAGPTPSAPQEVIGFRRSASLPGLEVFDAINAGRCMRWYHEAFGLGIPTTWQGLVRYRGREQTIGPGMALCVAPGELHVVARVEQIGTYNAVMFETSAFSGYAAEHGVNQRSIEWRVVNSRRLATRFADFLGLLEFQRSPMELQSGLVEVVETMLQELVLGGRRSVARVGSRAVQRMREMLHSSEGAKLDLETLAAAVGMSRFQALRAFKDRYGLPPHAYQVCSQLALSRTLLKSGQSVAQVAQACGFADQSHFGRTFKRFFYITPGAYARLGGGLNATPLDASDRHG